MLSNRVILRAAPNEQRGVVLLTGLLVLLVMTLFAVSAMTDIGVQNAMVRNNQLELLAYNNSMNEINAQVDQFNVRGEFDIFTDALNASDGQRVLTDGSPVLDENGDEVVDEAGNTVNTDDEIINDESGFDVDVTVTYLREQNIIPGYSFGQFSGLVYEMDVDSELAGTASRSNQVQGLFYIAPQQN